MPTANTLDVQHVIEGIPGHGWNSAESCERYIDAAMELLNEGWAMDRAFAFLSTLYNAALEECDD